MPESKCKPLPKWVVVSAVKLNLLDDKGVACPQRHAGDGRRAVIVAPYKAAQSSHARQPLRLLRHEPGARAAEVEGGGTRAEVARVQLAIEPLVERRLN